MAHFDLPLRSLDDISTGSGATTIFDSNQEPRFAELHEIRKQISQSINNFIVDHSSASKIPKERWEDLEIFDQLQDVDMARSLVALNVKNWICHAHTLLDLNNIFDRAMLWKMASYVQRVTRHLTSNPFLVEASVDAIRE